MRELSFYGCVNRIVYNEEDGLSIDKAVEFYSWQADLFNKKGC